MLCFLCFFFPVLVSVELVWSVPLVPLAVDPVEPVLDWPAVSVLEEPVPLVEPDCELLGDCEAVPEDCAAAIPIEKSAAVAIARSFFDILIS